jgi:nucleoside phosphorylase
MKNQFTKIYVLLILLTFLVFGVLYLSVQFSESRVPEIGVCAEELHSISRPFIVSAIGVETEAVKALIPTEYTCFSGNIVYYMGVFEGRQVVYFTTTKYGPDSVEDIKFTLTNFNVQILIFSGIGGRLDPALQIGDTVIPVRWIDITTGNSIEINPALQMIAGVNLDPKSGVTSPIFVVNGAEVYTSTGASIVDMESFYYAEVAQTYSVPFIAIRSVSDGADGQRDHESYVVASQASAQEALRFLHTFYSLTTP